MITSTRQVDGVTIVDISGRGVTIADISGRIVLGGGCAALGNLVCDLLSKRQKKIPFMVCSTCGSVTQRNVSIGGGHPLSKAERCKEEPRLGISRTIGVPQLR